MEKGVEKVCYAAGICKCQSSIDIPFFKLFFPFSQGQRGKVVHLQPLWHPGTGFTK
jgi:hypothetical protein